MWCSRVWSRSWAWPPEVGAAAAGRLSAGAPGWIEVGAAAWGSRFGRLQADKSGHGCGHHQQTGARLSASVACTLVLASVCRPRWNRLATLFALLGLGLSAAPAVRAEGVLPRVARSGQLQLVGQPNQPPILSLDGQGQPHGYAVVVAERVRALLAQSLGRAVRLNFQPSGDGEQAYQSLENGSADLACGVPFSWARATTVDFSVPIGVSGLRLLAPAGRFSGDPQGLAGRRIGVVRDSLADNELRGMQPAATVVPFGGLGEAVAALSSGAVDGVIGDTVLLKGLVQQRGLSGYALTPETPYERYGLVCAMPDNTSAFRNLVNLAITRLQQDYIDGDPRTVALVDRWLGPGSAINLPQNQIRTIFDNLLMGVEALRPVPPSSPQP